MSNLIIAGSRDFNDYKLLNERVTKLINDETSIDTIISGTARGADQLGEHYAKEHNLDVIRMPAQWDKYGRSAGYKRNAQMADIATYLIAFWDEQSKGTMHMINLAKDKQLIVCVVRTLAPDLPSLMWRPSTQQDDIDYSASPESGPPSTNEYNF